MTQLLQKLIASDTVIKNFSNNQEIIHQGLAPIIALNSYSKTIQKANLLERAKLINWQNKAQQLFIKLTEKGIKFLVFKGFAYTYMLYNQSNIRPYSDIDILIDETDYERMNVLLTELNYHCFPSRQGRFISFQNSFFDNNSPQTVIDLHWQINNRIEFHQYFKFADLYASAFVIQANNISFKTLNNIDAFIVGCFHYQAHRPDDRKHIWLYDLALLWSDMDKDQQMQCLQKAEITQQSKIISSTQTLLYKTFTHCISINETLKTKHAAEPTQDYLHKRNKKLVDIYTRLKNIKGLSNKIKFLSEYIFQSRDYVQHRYNLKSRLWLYFYYPRMWFEDIIKLFKS